jgi:predicted dehydrogenase
VVAASEEDLHDLPMSYRYGGIFSPFISLQEPLSIQDQHFVECIATGRRPLTNGENGLAVVEVLEAATLSLRQGEPVPLQAAWPYDGTDVERVSVGG